MKTDVYRRLYFRLFGVIADAVEALENNEPRSAHRMLIQALREAEESILSSGDEQDPP